ncbi:MAG: TIM-barrel domain-containing protein [Spirochaetota bacterium]
MFQSVEYDDMRENLLRKANVKFFIPREVKHIYGDSYGVTLLCSGREFRKEKMPPLFIQDDLCLMPHGPDVALAVRIEAFGEYSIRVRMRTLDSAESRPLMPERDTEMQVKTTPEKGLLRQRRVDEVGALNQDGRFLILSSGNVDVRIDLEDWNLSIGAASLLDDPVFRQYTRDEHAISHLVGQQEESHREAYDGFESFPCAIGYDPDSDQHFWTDAIELAYDEHFYGFGEKFGPLDKLGQEVLLWHTDSLSASSAKSYKNIPFFMSTAGYGLYLNTSAKCRFLMGSYHYKAYQMICHDAELDYFVFYGPELKQILPRYTDITGKTPMLPEWSFGTWMSKNTYRTQDELLSVAHKMRAKQIPCDVIHLDVGWFEHDWMCDYEFAKDRFPDPKAMSDELEELGYRLSVWQLPYFKKENKLYPEAMQQQLFARRPDGEVSTPEADGVLDLSNPQTVEWYQGKLKQLLDRGVSVIKVDFGESTEEEAVYKNGINGRQMHNLYPLLYNRAAFEITARESGEGIIWARSAWAGSQRYPLHWGGDSGSDFHGMYHSLRGGLSFGMSGFVFWSHDVGGYYGDTETDVYVRWAQMGMFSSHMRMHGTSSREPWVFGEEAEGIFLRYARLRYRLLPHIWREAEVCTAASHPMVSPLLLEFTGDRTTWHIDDQYLFGHSLLVAPVFSRRPTRSVYLPQGPCWYDFWNDEAISGGRWVQKDVPLDIMPLYVRGGTVLETGPVLNYAGEKEIDRLELHYYPALGGASGEAAEWSADLAVYGAGILNVKENCSADGEVRAGFVYTGGLPATLLIHGLEAEKCSAEGLSEIITGTPGI